MSITDIFPVSYQGAGKVRVQWVKTIAVPSAPTLAEINAATSLDATCYFQASAFEITHEQERVDDTRLCDESTRESFGRSTFSLQNLSYIYNPTGDTSTPTPGNMAASTFKSGESGYFVVRFGVASGAAFAATQVVAVYSAQFGDQHYPVPVGDNAKFVIQQPVSLTRVVANYKIPAGA